MNNTIAEYLNRHEIFLAEITSSLKPKANILKEAIIYSLFPGGKRLRPLLVYLSGTILKIPCAILDIIAAAIELMHTYSLIHDDLPAMDNDDYRRNKPSCHKVFGEAIAILVGDGLQALAVEVLLTKLPKFLPNANVINIANELIIGSGIHGMVSGQTMDLLNTSNLSEENLLEIHTLKSGKLITASILMVIAADNTANLAQHQALINYSKKLGLAFQVMDDYLDCYAPIKTLGKNRSSDKANKKHTFTSLYQKQELLQLIHTLFAKAKACILSKPLKAYELLQFTDSLIATLAEHPMTL